MVVIIELNNYMLDKCYFLIDLFHFITLIRHQQLKMNISKQKFAFL